MIAIPIVIVVLFVIWLFLIAPKNRQQMNKFKNIYYAHRGLHNEERAENSMSAFKAAVDSGYGIELDIRMTSDGKIVCVHAACVIDHHTGELLRIPVPLGK